MTNRLRERWLRRKIDEGYSQRDKYIRDYAVAEQAAYDRALTAAGITVHEWMPGLPQYRRGDKLVDVWSLSGILAPYYEAPDYNPPLGPDSEILREHSITVRILAGATRKQAEGIEATEEARLETIRLRCDAPRSGIRTVDASCDPRQPKMVSERTYNQLAGIPGRDEIVAFGPAQTQEV